MSTNLDDIIAAYKKFIAVQYPSYVKKYESTEKTNPDGAKFEATCYTILRSRGLRVEIGDTGTTGGADFICSGVSCRFVVEATTINTLAMEDKTKMKHDQTGILGGWYSAYPTLYQKLLGKVKQVAKYDIPRMISIGSFHNESLLLFRNVMADEYFSVFFNCENSRRPQLQDTLKDISAFLLVAISHDGYRAIGFLNPEPSYYFPIQFIPDIWFRQITQQGLADGTLLGEWISTDSNGQQSFKYPFEIVL
jgi:hypothetical protein